MKTICIIFLSVFLLTLSCKKDNENVPYYTHNTITGRLYNDVTGEVIPGQKIYFMIDDWLGTTEALTTDQNGVFYKKWDDYHPISTDMGVSQISKYYLFACIDSLAAILICDYRGLINNGVNICDMHLKPIGYLKLTLSHLGSAPIYDIKFFKEIAGSYEYIWRYNAQQNNYADTTNTLKVYGNTMVHVCSDSVFVPAHDTIPLTITF